MAKRTTRFYRKNEEDVMRTLGLVPTKNSGAGWIEKEDGQNDYLIAQLKSTDAESMRIALRDIDILEYNAIIAHKIPIFVIQFLSTGDTMVMMRPADIHKVSEYIESGVCKVSEPAFEVDPDEDKPDTTIVKSSSKSRSHFWNQREKGYKNVKRSKVQNSRHV